MSERVPASGNCILDVSFPFVNAQKVIKLIRRLCEEKEPATHNILIISPAAALAVPDLGVVSSRRLYNTCHLWSQS